MLIEVNEKSKLVDVNCIISSDNNGFGGLWLGNYQSAQCFEWLIANKIKFVFILLTYLNEELVQKYKEAGISCQLFRAFD